MIQSGMVFTELEDKIILILKETAEMVSALITVNSAKMDFEYIDRPEFPSIGADLRMKTVKGLSVKYSYFFNSEAEYELNLLEKILNQREVYLCFFSDILTMSCILQLEEHEKVSLAGIINKFNS